MTTSSKLTDSAVEHVDVLIIGAGISGLGAACHIQNECNNKSCLILEGRDAIGGTWDLFKYPGIRSDSDLYTFGYDFKPWHGQPIATAPEILSYLNEVVDENNLAPNLRFNQWVTTADWSSDDARWSVMATTDGKTKRYSGNFLFMVSGLLQLRSGLPARLSRAGRFFWPHHSPATLARRPRLQQQKNGGYWFWRNSRNHTARCRRNRGSRHSAATLTQLLPRARQHRRRRDD